MPQLKSDGFNVFAVAKSQHWAFMTWLQDSSGRPVGNMENVENVAPGGILLIRDLWNWAASTSLAAYLGKERWGGWGKYHQRVTVWCRHAEAYLNENLRATKVRTDHFYTDPEYRARLAASLGFESDEESIKVVKRPPGGSNAQPDLVDASKLKWNERWKDALASEYREQYLAPLRLAPVKLNERIFGPAPFDLESETSPHPVGDAS